VGKHALDDAVLLIFSWCFCTFQTNGTINGTIDEHDFVDQRTPELRSFLRRLLGPFVLFCHSIFIHD